MTKKKKIRWKQYLPIYLLALPGILYMICNNYLPMFGIVIAFKKLNFAKGILASPWCGLKNFEFLFKSSAAFTMIRNTICYNVLWLILGHVLAIASAILLNEITNRFRARFYQCVILLPYLMSWVVVSYLVFAFLSADTGMFNNSILKPLGLAPINWYSESKYWPFILTFVNHWKNNGYTMIVYFASIVGISQDYYEAAMLDGATKWQQIKHITIPQLVPTIITLMILSVGRIFASDFGLFYQIPRNTGALYNATQTIDVYVYNALMQRSDYGMASAASVFQSIVGFLMVMVTNAIVRKVSRENAMF